MKKFKFKINGQNYEAEVSEFDGVNATVEINGTPYSIEVTGEEMKSKPKTPVLSNKPVVNQAGEGEIKKTPTTTGGSMYKVTAPLPGLIKKVSVAVGSSVKIGDVVMIMEAMKMDNNIITDKSGTVKSVKAKEGDSVLQGDVLLEIE
ncbi:MAG: acetyl-CoA carboxylase biotin carboxyl carrier protein subunit [Culturomica sp.]|jgi:biotin carboxyl carrier protein|nr:acetyl-CoA carboxylase biotin carboxyl carrier protein subunit [Culturomica sp.]